MTVDKARSFEADGFGMSIAWSTPALNGVSEEEDRRVPLGPQNVDEARQIG
jgi:hypothetical protein